MKNSLIIAVVLILAIYGYQKFQKQTDPIDPPQVSELTLEEVDNIAPSYNDHRPAPLSTNTNSANSPISSKFSCDGRQHCSQMTSCEEATYFLQHCPNTQMDGNNDGIPCEKQWCK